MSTIYKNNALERFYVYGSGRSLSSGPGTGDRRVKKAKTGMTSADEFSVLLARQMAGGQRG